MFSQVTGVINKHVNISDTVRTFLLLIQGNVVYLRIHPSSRDLSVAMAPPSVSNLQQQQA